MEKVDEQTQERLQQKFAKREEKKKLDVWMPLSFYKQVGYWAKLLRLSKAEFIRRALERFIDEIVKEKNNQ